MKADIAATVIMMTKIALTSPFPENFVTHSPIISVTPVWESPADKTKTAATIIAGSLENPEKASFISIRPVMERAKMMSIAMTSTLKYSVMNKKMETIMIIIKII